MNKARQYHSDLASLLTGIFHVPSALNTQIHGLVSDSRKVKQGDLFVALSGLSSSSEQYVEDAIANGAAAILIDCDEGDDTKDRAVHEDGSAVELYIPNLKQHIGAIAHRFFHRPSDEMQVIGVTGTNGKTSVANYIAQFFSASGYATAVVGTLGYGLCAQGEELIDTGHTTPNIVDVHRILAHLRDAGAELVAMEVSSHGLEQGRVSGVNFEGAVFTNLSRDHLDYHNTMDEYAAAKAKLFSWPSLRYVVINADDEYARTMFQTVAPEVRKVRFSLDQDSSAEVVARQFSNGKRTTANVQVGTQSLSLDSPLLGRFNLYNLLAVLGVALAKSGDVGALENINSVRAVAGRLEAYEASQHPAMIVDYAHTPDALENVLIAISELKASRVITVFGCGGDRDVGKRAEMANIAERYSDEVIITSDNPRSEDPEKILQDIQSGFVSSNYMKVADRASAIREAHKLASIDDIVLVAGKGHENYQEVDGERTYFSDAEQCRSLLGLVASPHQLGEGAKT